MPSCPSKGRRTPLVPGKPGFTLVEMLVVVAVIAMLVAILMPALGQARGKAREISCGNSQKQIGVAISFYIDDFNDWLPRHAGNQVGGWYYHQMFVGMQYFKDTKIFLCPSDLSPWSYSTCPGCSYGLNFRTCGMAVADLSASASSWVTLTQLARWPKKLSGAALLADNGPDTGAFFHPTLTLAYVVPPQVVYGVTPRHGNGANVLYADMHVRWVKAPFGALTTRAWQFCPDAEQEW